MATSPLPPGPAVRTARASASTRRPAGRAAAEPARGDAESRLTPSPPVAAAAWLRRRTALRPALGIVLGSGFGSAAQRVKVEAEFMVAQIPGFPRGTVAGHAGRVVFGHLGGEQVVVLSGRAHYYEGFSMAEVTFPVRALAALGVRAVMLTNAAGAIRRGWRPGEFMILRDQINFMGANPLRGPAPEGLTPFVDLSAVYDPDLGAALRRAARHARVTVRCGVYLAVAGPTYETPAEIRAFARLGADAVGMSTVPEAIVARQCGLRVAGLSCLTNLAAGRSPGPLDPAEVLATGERVAREAADLLEAFAPLAGAVVAGEPRGR